MRYNHQGFTLQQCWCDICNGPHPDVKFVRAAGRAMVRGPRHFAAERLFVPYFAVCPVTGRAFETQINVATTDADKNAVPKRELRVSKTEL